MVYFSPAHKNSIFIFTYHTINYLGLTPFSNKFPRNKETPSFLEGRCLAHGGKSPSTLVPCLVATAHPLLSNPPHPFPTPSAHIMIQQQHQQLRSYCPEHCLLLLYTEKDGTQSHLELIDEKLVEKFEALLPRVSQATNRCTQYTH
jgi:hypothetical protein